MTLDPVDSFDWDVVGFMLIWAPYGGPTEEECVPRFGMSRLELHARFANVMRKLSRISPANFTDPQRELIARGRRLFESLALVNEPTTMSYRPDEHFSADIDEAAGRWIMRQCVWHWTTD